MAAMVKQVCSWRMGSVIIDRGWKDIATHDPTGYNDKGCEGNVVIQDGKE